MFKFLRGLLGGVARGLAWTARLAVMLPVEIGESMWTAMWRTLFPPPAEQEESTADVLRQVAGMIAGREERADANAVAERPVPKAASEATVRRSMERGVGLHHRDAQRGYTALPRARAAQPVPRAPSTAAGRRRGDASRVDGGPGHGYGRMGSAAARGDGAGP